MKRCLPLLRGLKAGPYIPLVRATALAPPVISKVQTDGSFNPDTKISRTALAITKDDVFVNSFVRTYFDHENSMESEWCSVLTALDFLRKKNYAAANLENDNLTVINNIIQSKPPKDILYRFYYEMIFEQLPAFEWIGIRWIPRAQNKADKLFRI